MIRFRTSMFVASALALIATTGAAQDAAKAVANGGISVKGWTGKIDANEARSGQTLSNARLAKHGKGVHVTTGPAAVYWEPKNTAKGDYTVSATFNEEKYMSLNDHPHPYGIFIGGNDMGTDSQSYLYCAAYGNGSFIVRGFGPQAFALNGGRGEKNDAVHKAEGQGKPVTQDIAVSVKGDQVSCAINGKVVATYEKSNLVGNGKLKSTDGTYGIRFGHNTEALVTNLKMKKG